MFQILNCIVQSTLIDVQLQTQNTAYTIYDDSAVDSKVEQLLQQYPTSRHIEWSVFEVEKQIQHFWKHQLLRTDQASLELPSLSACIVSIFSGRSLKTTTHDPQFSAEEITSFQMKELQALNVSATIPSIQAQQSRDFNSHAYLIFPGNKLVHKAAAIAQGFNIELAPQSRERLLRFCNFQRLVTTVVEQASVVTEEQSSSVLVKGAYYMQQLLDGLCLVKVFIMCTCFFTSA